MARYNTFALLVLALPLLATATAPVVDVEKRSPALLDTLPMAKQVMQPVSGLNLGKTVKQATKAAPVAAPVQQASKKTLVSNDLVKRSSHKSKNSSCRRKQGSVCRLWSFADAHSGRPCSSKHHHKSSKHHKSSSSYGSDPLGNPLSNSLLDTASSGLTKYDDKLDSTSNSGASKLGSTKNLVPGSSPLGSLPLGSTGGLIKKRAIKAAAHVYVRLIAESDVRSAVEGSCEHLRKHGKHGHKQVHCRDA